MLLLIYSYTIYLINYDNILRITLYSFTHKNHSYISKGGGSIAI